MSILVTGGLGGLGSAVIQQLYGSTTERIVILDNLSSASFDPRSLDSRVVFYRGDVCNEELVGYLLQKHSVHSIIDCSSRKTPKDVLDAAEVIKTFTHLLEATRQYKKLKHFLLASRPQESSEDQPLQPGEFELASLMSIEAILHSYVVSYRLPLVTARVGQLAERIGELKGGDIVNLISTSDASRGVLAALNGEPAGVYNIVGPQDLDLKTKQLLPSRFCGKKASTLLGFTASQAKVSDHVSSPPEKLAKVLLFGVGTAYDKIRVQLGQMGVEYEEGTTWPGLNTDKEISDELTHAAPSHLICICNSSLDEGSDTPCEILKTTSYGLLFPPWQLASLCMKRGIHFTFIGSDQLFSKEQMENSPLKEEIVGNNQETNHGPIRAYTERLLTHFPAALKFRLSDAATTDCSIAKILRLIITCSSGVWNVVTPGISSHLDGSKFQNFI